MNMNPGNTAYFEQSEVWDENYRRTPGEEARLKATLEHIPADVETLLDVGCGSGIFVNECASGDRRRFGRVAGADISEEALKSVRTEKHHCQITALPFEDREFDLVTVLEVLEHVSSVDIEKALNEISRVADKYVLATVPNKENLCQNLVICSKCLCCFSPWGHVRSFVSGDMEGLFSEFELITCKTIGPVVERLVYHPAVKGASLLSRRPAMPQNAICPQCGYRHETSSEASPDNSNSGTVLKKTAKSLIGTKLKKEKWLLALHKRSS